MKRMIAVTGLGLVVCVLLQSGLAQSRRYTVEERSTIRRTLDFAGSGSRTVEVDNLTGSIRVVSHNGKNVEMVAMSKEKT